MSVALQRHDEIVSKAVAHSGGRILKHTGDGIVASFDDAPAAVQAALDTQRGLAREDFSEVGGLSVRMGIHAGRAQQRDGDLYGPTLNQCGRVMSAAHGGQVIATSTVASILRDDYATWCTSVNVDLLDLGVHRFKGLSNPERLFQVTHPEVASTFPSPRSLNALIGNLPPALPTLFGRDDLIAEVEELLTRPSVVTLTGPAGVGKTSVALRVGQQLVDRFPDGVWTVDLSLVTDGAGVATAIAQTLGIAPRLGQSLEETLKDALGVRRALVILDNAQRPREGVASCLNQVIVHGSLVRILATSFAAVGVSGEQRVRVAPLDLPGDTDLRDLEAAERSGRPSNCSSTARAPCRPILLSPMEIFQRWRRSASTSTDSPWRLNWRPRGWNYFPRNRSRLGYPNGSNCCTLRRGRWDDIRPWTPHSPGASNS